MRVLVIGAGGQIGRQLVPLLLAQKMSVRAMVRTPQQGPPLQALGAEVAVADLEGDFEAVLADCDAVVFSAGSGGKTGADKTLLVDVWGALKSIRAAKQHHLSHYLMIRSRGARDPDQGPTAIKPYCVAKHVVDNELMASGLTYTILRPGRLTDDPATGQVTTERPAEAAAQIIPRADVAQAIVHCLKHPAQGRIAELYQGDTPLPQALTP